MSDYMSFSCRGIYEIVRTHGPEYIPAGTVQFNNVLVVSHACTNCLVDNMTKYKAFHTSWYQFEISGTTNNRFEGTDESLSSFWLDLDVKHQLDDGSDAQVVRRFKDYTPGYGNFSGSANSQRTFVLRFEHYMAVNSKIWIHNNNQNTLRIGPLQYRFTFLVSIYVE